MTAEFRRPPRRTAFISALNVAVGAASRLGALAPPDLGKDALLDAARAQTDGLTDFGDPWFDAPFDALLSALPEARLNPAGEITAAKQFHHLLRDRLLAQDWYRRHPEILARPLRRPVVIVGPMRSGTTRLHRLLASDRRFAHLRSFETISPVPRADFEDVLEGRAADFRPVLAKRILRVARLANPRTLSIHPTGPYQPEEELGLLAASLYGMKFEAQWAIPSYTAWAEGVDARPAYRAMADLLRLVGWSQQESSLRPWILKTPQHMLDLPALLAVFPDARLIFTHRDPRAVVGSAASLAWNQTIIYSDHGRADAVGREWLRKTGLMTDRMMAARRTIPAERAIDVHYDEVERDWPGVMARIYRFLELDLEPALPAMQRYMAASAGLKRRPHTYDLAQFGLTETAVRDRMAAYTAAYAVPEENGGAKRGRA